MDGVSEWKCCGCGAESPDRYRSCDCATDCVYRGDVQAIKIDRSALTTSYLEQMRAHVDEGGQLTHRNAIDLLAEVERLQKR